MKKKLNQVKFTVFKRIAIALFLVQLIIFPTFISSAAGPIEPVGPQGKVGVQEAIGPQGEVGPNQSVGPQGSSANLLTGPNSENSNLATKNNNAEVEVQKKADISNNVEADLNTGKNEVKQNTAVRNVKTGPIDGSVNIINTANSDLAPGSSVGSQTIDGAKSKEIILNPSTERSDLARGKNQATGPNSRNQNREQNNNIIQVLEDKQATAENTVLIEADTGNNLLSNNTQVNGLQTGDIDLAVNLLNLLNLSAPNTVFNLDIWSILNDYSGDIVLPNELINQLTGPQSANQNNTTNNKNKQISVEQRASTDNDIVFETNTGKNKVSEATRSGNIKTGNTNIDSTTTNVSNVDSPFLYIVNVFGKWTGSLLGLDPNTFIVNEINNTTGPNSENTNSSEVNEETNARTLSESNVENDVVVRANTGKNELENNTVLGNIETGSIDIMSNVINVLNSFSETLDHFNLGIINIFGNWRGNATDQATANKIQEERIRAERSRERESKGSNIPNSKPVRTEIPERTVIQTKKDSSIKPGSLEVSLIPKGKSSWSEAGREKTRKSIASEKSDYKLAGALEDSSAPPSSGGSIVVEGVNGKSLVQGIISYLNSPIGYIILISLGIVLVWGLLEILVNHQENLSKNLVGKEKV